MKRGQPYIAALTLGLGAFLSGSVLAQDITIAAGAHPESIAAAADGSLLVSSITQGIVYRVAPGAASAEPWITDIGPAVTGVFAHEDSVYVCSNGAFGANEPGFFKVYDLTSGEETASYEFPAGGLCSDTAAGPDGTIYVTQLGAAPGRIFRLTSDGLEEALADDALAGLDGLAFIGETLYANNLQTGELYRINLDANPVDFTKLTLSQPLERPDGMRTTEDGQSLLIAEAQGNRIVRVTITGDTAAVAEIVGGLEGGPTGVAQLGDTVYVVEGHFYALSPDAGRTPPEMFVIRAFPFS